MQNKVSGLSVFFRWNTLKAAPSKTFPRSRSRHASCLHGDYVYVIGGKDGHVSLKDVWRFHIGNAEWERLNFHGDKLPFLEGHSVVSHKRLLLLFGGTFGDDLTDSSLWILNPDLQHVRKLHNDLGSPQPCVRRQHSAVLHENVMYIYGGYVDLKGSSSELWAFHIEEEEWELVIQHQRLEETPGGRHGHSAVMYGRDMWVFGGACDLTPKSDLWYFNFHLMKWTKFKARFGPPCLTGHSAEVIKDNMIIFGGEREKTLTNDFWVFNFGSLRWTHIQLSGVTPPARMWHTMVAITAANYPKGENSVRTCSLPYLQNKGTTHRQRRPKSSPAYSSARTSKRPRAENETKRETQNSDINMTTNDIEMGMTNENQNGNSSKTSSLEASVRSAGVVRRPTNLDFGTQKEKRYSYGLPVVMTTTTVKVKEEKSPLLANRQLSVNSVDSTSSLQGTDNPCLSLSNDVINQTAESSFTDQSKLFSTSLSQQQSKYEQRYLKRGQRSRSRSTNDGEEAMIPMDDIPKSVIRVRPYSSGQRSRLFQSGKEDIVVEDLEFCDNYYSSSTSNISVKKLTARHAVNTLRDRQKISSTNGKTGIEMMYRQNSKNFMSQFSDSKSRSLSDLSSGIETYHVELNTSTQCSKDDDEIARRLSVKCWESPVSEVPIMTQSANDLLFSGSSALYSNGSIADSSFMTPSPSNRNSNPKPSVVQTKDTVRESRESLFLAKQNPKEEVDNRKADEEKTVTVTPCLILFGGKEGKGSNLKIEPISIWKCDVLMRHSDISHGEYHKSSLII